MKWLPPASSRFLPPQTASASRTFRGHAECKQPVVEDHSQLKMKRDVLPFKYAEKVVYISVHF